MRAYLYGLATDERHGFVARLAKAVLYILSLIYGVSVAVIMGSCLLRQVRLPCKVISVGNITVGGTGKTPLVAFIAGYLTRQGHKVAIVTRGYMRDKHLAMGDEAYMLQQKLKGIPVIVDADRLRGGTSAIERYGVDTIILDDGFQQWGLKKDLEIVTIDATNPFGNRRMLPRGILRQPLATLRQADVIVLTKTNMRSSASAQAGFLPQLRSDAAIFETAYLPLGFYRLDKPDQMLGVRSLSEHAALFVSGIASPGSFEQTMKTIGVAPAAHLIFEDHHRYTQADWSGILDRCRQEGVTTVVTTEKDGVRLQPYAQASGGITVLALRIELTFIDDEDGFYQRLRRVYNV